MACKHADSERACSYPVKDRNIRVPERYSISLRSVIPRSTSNDISYVRELEQKLEQMKSIMPAVDAAEASRDIAVNASSNVSIGIKERDSDSSSNAAGQPSEETVARDGQAMPQQLELTGDSSCTTFANQLLNSVGAANVAQELSAASKPRFSHDALRRSSEPCFELPNRIQASLLVQRALKFIGTDYHLIRRKSFFRRLDHAYTSNQPADRAWTCSLFVMLALGELYSNWHGDGSEASIPGTRYFLQAVSLHEDRYEDASIDSVQALNLLVRHPGRQAAYFRQPLI